MGLSRRTWSSSSADSHVRFEKAREATYLTSSLLRSDRANNGHRNSKGTRTWGPLVKFRSVANSNSLRILVLYWTSCKEISKCRKSHRSRPSFRCSLDASTTKAQSMTPWSVSSISRSRAPSAGPAQAYTVRTASAGRPMSTVDSVAWSN